MGGAGCPIPKNPTPSRPCLSPPPNFQTPQSLKNPFLCPDGRVSTGERRLAESLSSITEQVIQCFDAIDYSKPFDSTWILYLLTTLVNWFIPFVGDDAKCISNFKKKQSCIRYSKRRKFRPKMRQNAFGGRAAPGPAGELKHSPRPPSRN